MYLNSRSCILVFPLHKPNRSKNSRAMTRSTQSQKCGKFKKKVQSKLFFCPQELPLLSGGWGWVIGLAATRRFRELMRYNYRHQNLNCHSTHFPFQGTKDLGGQGSIFVWASAYIEHQSFSLFRSNRILIHRKYWKRLVSHLHQKFSFCSYIPTMSNISQINSDQPKYTKIHPHQLILTKINKDQPRPTNQPTHQPTKSANQEKKRKKALKPCFIK